MEHVPHAPRHDDAGDSIDDSDPPEDDEEDDAIDEPETPGEQHERYEADRRIKESPEMRRHILAFYVEGVPRGDIALSLEKFGLKATKRIAVLQTANLKALRQEFALNTINAERTDARHYIIEKLPQLAWRLLPRSRAFLAFCMGDTRATLKLIAEASDAYMKTIDPRLPGASAAALSDLINSEKGGGSRDNLARYFRTRPHKLTDVQLANAKAEGEATFGNRFKRAESLARFNSDWILDDNNRALLVTLLDLGEEKARQAAVTWALATSIPDSGVTISMINSNVRQYGGYQQFADAIRIGTESIAPGLKKRAEELVAEYDAKIEKGKIPEWRRTPEQKAFLCFLIQDSGLSTELMSWAHSAHFGTPVKHSALKEYIRYRGGAAAYVAELRAEITDAQLNAASKINLKALKGYADLTAQRKRAVDVVELDTFKPLRRLAENVKNRERSSVPRVNVYYGKASLQREKEGRTLAINPQGQLPESLTIEFVPSIVKRDSADSRAATDNAMTLRDLLRKEMAWIADKKGTPNTGGKVSQWTLALLDRSKTGEPIRTVEIRWKIYKDVGDVDEGHERYQIDGAFVNAVRANERARGK